MRFRDFFRLMENDVPAGVDPEMWANPSYQKFWLAQNQPQQPQQQMKQTPLKPAPQLNPATLSQNNHQVAPNIQIAMSAAGRMTYPFYWSERDKKVKPNGSYIGPKT